MQVPTVPERLPLIRLVDRPFVAARLALLTFARLALGLPPTVAVAVLVLHAVRLVRHSLSPVFSAAAPAPVQGPAPLARRPRDPAIRAAGHVVSGALAARVVARPAADGDTVPCVGPIGQHAVTACERLVPVRLLARPVLRVPVAGTLASARGSAYRPRAKVLAGLAE